MEPVRGRAVSGQTERELYEFGPFRVDPEKEVLLRDGRPVSLTPKTFQILLVLVRHGQEVVTKDDLMTAVWPDTFVEEANLSRNIFMLRRALEADAQDHRYIVTVPGRGYRLTESVRRLPDAGVSIAADSHTRVHVEVKETFPWKWMVATAALVLVIGAALFRMLSAPAPRLSEKDTVVLADFRNSTGDPVFDGTLKQGIAVQLAQSPFLSLVSDPRIQRTLTLMGQAADTRLTSEIAREVCERAGAAVVLDGSIASLGSEYVLGVRVRNCHTGDTLDEEQVQIARKEEVLAALSKVATRFRMRVGESLASVDKYSTPLAEATTTSLEALKAYTAGWQVHASRGATASMPLFQRATEIDPGFAMAHSSLSRVYADLDESDLASRSMETSWQLRDRASEAERYFLTANYQMLVTGNMDKAQRTCEEWARAYPRDARPHTMLAGLINKTPGRFEIALKSARKAVEADPDFAISYYSIGANSQYLERLDDAEQALRAAAARGLDIDEFIMLAYDLAFLKGDTARLAREAARARARPGGENWMSAREALVAAYSGHLHAARSLSQRAVVQAHQAGQSERASLWEAGAAVREALFGNGPAGRARALAALDLPHNREAQYGAALALILADDSSPTQALIDDLEQRFPEDTSVQFSYLPVLRALSALNRHEPQRALEFLQLAAPHESGVPRSTVSALFGALYPPYVRGLVYLATSRGPEAAAEFQKILDHPGIVVDDPIGPLARLQLGRAYAVAGDRTKARAAYADFFSLWREADPDIPVLRQARAEYAHLL